MIASKLPIGDFQWEEDGKTFFSEILLVVSDKAVTDVHQISRDTVYDGTSFPVATGEVRKGVRLPLNDKQKAEKIVKALSERGYEVISDQEIPDLNSFTDEELTVHLYREFKLRKKESQ